VSHVLQVAPAKLVLQVHVQVAGAPLTAEAWLLHTATVLHTPHVG
jgi:hypothetical protein